MPKPSGDWFRAVIDFCQLCIELDKDIEARNTGIEAVQLCSSFKLAADTELELRSTVASVVSNLGEPNAALELLQVSPQVVDAASDWGRVTLLWAEATAHSDLGDTEKAVSRANEALKLLKPLRREFSFARLQNTVAAFEIQRDHPDWDRAERLLASAVATFRRLGAEVDLGQTLGTTGDMWARRGDLGAAKAAFAEALASVPDSAGALKACIHVEQATAFLRANATEEAREHLQSARLLLNSERPTRYQLQLWHRLAFMFEQKGDLGAAMLCIKEAAR